MRLKYLSPLGMGQYENGMPLLSCPKIMSIQEIIPQPSKCVSALHVALKHTENILPYIL